MRTDDRDCAATAFPPPFFFPRDGELLLPPSLTPWQATVRLRSQRLALAVICVVPAAIVIAQWRALEALREALRLCR